MEGADWTARIDAIERAGQSRLGAVILMAAQAGMAGDSRTFARRFGVAHALVLREAVILHEAGLLEALGPPDAPRRPLIPTARGAALAD
ncbi:hypothetical protein [Falsirhodobacter algicola]|uniref:Formate dehydrogenase F4B subunit n=1 Tax=Falsirhodobacter algicola TaxID=2692330 RepID=A0A8J8SLE7_9RHOB|nr:hypothetical protein [Falsirhodobacter algicola]QUS37000.1 hypothetical protein GR316_11435 [Falsirhodobacter algicola]